MLCVDFGVSLVVLYRLVAKSNDSSSWEVVVELWSSLHVVSFLPIVSWKVVLYRWVVDSGPLILRLS